MKNIIRLSFLILSTNSFGQSFGWVNTGIGNENIEGKKVISADNEDIIVAGSLEGSGVFSNSNIIAIGDEDFFLARYDSSGNNLWSRAYGGFEKDKIKGLAKGPNNTIYVCGSNEGSMIIDTLIFNNLDGSNGFLAQLDQEGNIIWGLNLESNDEISASAIAVSELDSIAYISGHFKDSAFIGSYSISSFASESFFVAAVDYFGNVIWVSTGASQDEVEPLSMSLGADSSIIILGNFEGNFLVGSNVLPNSTDSDVFLLCLDQTGEFIWAKSIGGTNDIEGSSVKSDEQGNIFIVGSFEDEVHFNTDSLTSTDDKDGFFARFDKDGNELWVKALSGTSDVQPNDIFVDNYFQEIYITGSIDGTCYFDTLAIINNTGTDLFIVKYDTSGTVMWGKGIGGSGSVEGYALSADNNSNPIITGYFDGTAFFDEISISGFSDHDFFIGKITPSEDTASLSEIEYMENKVVLYPNPVNQSIYISFEYPNAPTNLTLELTDAQGRHIRNLRWEQNKSINVTSLDRGLYFLKNQKLVLRFYKQ
tara:strand:- start:1970 stop:3574 length:1605 start_codon:yes stop_codon:yes gene_type:complete